MPLIIVILVFFQIIDHICLVINNEHQYDSHSDHIL